MTKKNVATSGIGPSNSYQNASFAERKESAQLTSYTTEQLREALKLSEYDDPRPFWDKWKTHATLVVKNAAADHLKHMETECCRGLAPDSECRCALEAKPEGERVRPCTCHPDDNPPVPCAGRYALSECKESSPVIPEGYALVPIEPTEEIITMVAKSGWKPARDAAVREWKAMIAAAQEKGINNGNE